MPCRRQRPCRDSPPPPPSPSSSFPMLPVRRSDRLAARRLERFQRSSSLPLPSLNAAISVCERRPRLLSRPSSISPSPCRRRSPSLRSFPLPLSSSGLPNAGTFFSPRLFPTYYASPSPSISAVSPREAHMYLPYDVTTLPKDAPIGWQILPPQASDWQSSSSGSTSRSPTLVPLPVPSPLLPVLPVPGLPSSPDSPAPPCLPVTLFVRKATTGTSDLGLPTLTSPGRGHHLPPYQRRNHQHRQRNFC